MSQGVRSQSARASCCYRCKLISWPCFSCLSLQLIQDPWLLSTSDVERERAVDTIFSLLQTFRDSMLLTVGGVGFDTLFYSVKAEVAFIADGFACRVRK